MSIHRTMAVGQELPSWPIYWRERTTETAAPSLIDFSSGWTFTLRIAKQSAPTVAVATKTTGITGASTGPNVTIDWATTDTATLDPGAYLVTLVARRAADSKDRDFSPGDPIRLTLVARAA